MTTAPSTLLRDPGEHANLTGGLELFLHLLRHWRLLGRAPVQAALWYQVRRGALDFSWLAAAVGTLAGFFTIGTVGVGFGLGVTVGVHVMQVLVLGQLAGFACALLLVAGPGTSATFALGLMRQQGELRTLRLMGIEPRAFLALPRVLGFSLALFVLSFVFQLAAVIGGFALAALVTHLSFTQQFDALVATLKPAALVVTGVRSLVLGAVIGLQVCDRGLGPSFAVARMPRISRQLLSESLVALVLVHGLTALLLP